jgi:hypothetical protein
MRTAFDLSELANRQVVSAAGVAPSLFSGCPGSECSADPSEPSRWLSCWVPVSDRHADQVQAGLALQRVLLTATALGLTASFLSQPIEVTEQRRQLTTLLANRLHPQAILRLGFSPPVTAATSTPMSPLTIRATTICALPVQSSRSTVTR